VLAASIIKAMITLMMEAANTFENFGKLLPDYTAQQSYMTAIFILAAVRT
jgi:hypothetical protein